MLLAVGVYAAACASSSSTSGGDTGTVQADMSTSPPSPDPRVGLAPGTLKRWEKDTTRFVIDRPAAEAIWNMRLLSNTPPADPFRGVTNSDIAFRGNYAIQGNYNGYMVWDVSNPRNPTLKTSMYCPASQSDVSVRGNVLFVSSESNSGRLDCGGQGVPEPVSEHRIRGIRIFEASDISKPKYLANVQTCRGSHTHTVVSDPNDPNNVYVYISGSSGVRSTQELPGCLQPPPDTTISEAEQLRRERDDPNAARFRIEIIQVPLAAPQNAKIVGAARIFHDLVAAPTHGPSPADTVGRGAGAAGGRGGRGGGGGRGGQPPANRPADTGPRVGPNQCHDITVYPEAGLAGGACGGYGLLLDIRNVAAPRRLDAVADSNFSYWHSATFSNDAKKILYTDEWGGGGAPRCRPLDKYEWGGNAIFTIENNKQVFKSYYKMPAPQTTLENCVAHNGSLIPIPGREIMVQGWYQGGVSIFDWTDPSRPKEIAFHDRGPSDGTRQGPGGVWSVYWYNGYMYSSEIARGLDIFELVPSAFITQNEIDAAKTVIFPELNAQEQKRFVWPPSFPLARAYVDQLQRSSGLSTDRIAAVRAALQTAERASGNNRRTALQQLATQLHSDANGSRDAAKVHTLAGAVEQLAAATR